MDSDNIEDATEPLLPIAGKLAVVGSSVSPIESLDYEVAENELFSEDWRSRGDVEIVQRVIVKWSLCFLVGALSGGLGFFNTLAVENIAGMKFVVTSNLMLAQKYYWAFGVFVMSNFVLTMLAAVMTACIAPAAAGSGIPEVMAYLNGVDLPEVFSFRTLVVKVIGCIVAVSSSLHVGKASPMVHTSTCIAPIMGQGSSRKYRLTCKWLR